MRSRSSIKWAALVAALLFAFVSGDGPAHARPEARRLLVSIYDSEAAAADALRSLKAARDRGAVDVEAYALVAKEMNGKVKLRERRARGSRPGQAVAALGGVLGVRTGTGLGATSSAAIAYLTSNVIGMQRDVVYTLPDMLPRGGAALVSAIDQPHADAALAVQEIGAARVLFHDLPATIEQPDGTTEPVAPIPRPQVVPGSP